MQEKDKKELRELAEQLKQNSALQKLLALTYAKGLRDAQGIFEQPDGDGSNSNTRRSA